MALSFLLFILDRQQRPSQVTNGTAHVMTRCGEIVALRWGFLEDPLTLLIYPAHLQSIQQYIWLLKTSSGTVARITKTLNFSSMLPSAYELPATNEGETAWKNYFEILSQYTAINVHCYEKIHLHVPKGPWMQGHCFVCQSFFLLSVPWWCSSRLGLAILIFFGLMSLSSQRVCLEVSTHVCIYMTSKGDHWAVPMAICLRL